MVAFTWHSTLRARALLAGLALTFAVAGFFTYNRASWLGVVLGAVVLSLYYRRWRRLLLPAVAILALVAVLSWPVISEYPLVSERLLREQTVDDRLNNVDAAITLWQQQPLFGIGYGSFGEAAMDQGLLPRLPNFVPAPHNGYLFVLTSGGLLAGIPYVLLMLLIGFDLWRFERFRRRASLPGTAGTAGTADKMETAVWRGMLAGAMAVLVIQAVTSATYDAALGTLTSLLFFLIVGTAYGLHHAERCRVAPAGTV